MNIKITLDNLDSAIKQIEELRSKVRDLSADLAEDYRTQVGYDDVSIHHGGSNATIVASGEQIAFEEWGAGYTADYNSGYEHMGGDSFFTYPGVWSESHERTFQHHQESGKDPSTYHYNKEPKHYMENTARRIQTEIDQKVRERFK